MQLYIYICNYDLLYLDLSFNNIEVIEGLDKLTHLEDLTLFNNRIHHLENMDTLTKLHVLSVGNNDLKELDNVSSLLFSLILIIHSFIHSLLVKLTYHSRTPDSSGYTIQASRNLITVFIQC